jgi:hypothetical protein
MIFATLKNVLNYPFPDNHANKFALALKEAYRKFLKIGLIEMMVSVRKLGIDPQLFKSTLQADYSLAEKTYRLIIDTSNLNKNNYPRKDLSHLATLENNLNLLPDTDTIGWIFSSKVSPYIADISQENFYQMKIILFFLENYWKDFSEIIDPAKQMESLVNETAFVVDKIQPALTQGVIFASWNQQGLELLLEALYLTKGIKEKEILNRLRTNEFDLLFDSFLAEENKPS